MSWFWRPVPRFCRECGTGLRVESTVTRWDEITGDPARVTWRVVCPHDDDWNDHTYRRITAAQAYAWRP